MTQQSGQHTPGRLIPTQTGHSKGFQVLATGGCGGTGNDLRFCRSR
ncbi:hypothetical protein MAR_020116 [Mya arenaria]|uniref:Uncharacterized protein n=1 Tax=Mya arenaria TaxID=6604 RepID=A0ABY7E414_MYAAR|nr:hypothetical protein MAR_020116 [Mya arenaria]